ncbi:arabinose operon regulatory protein [Citrobacter koseri]|uniref:Arabinose operon regulatory protein n=1 Tax=Citrobacter koseri TaxID=545 RepID=A0A3S4KNK0_CITKO|nr:arabinose operon regulatory protein [Citrobacter koseri]
MAETQNDPLLPGYSFNAHLVAGLTPLRRTAIWIFLSTARWG